MSNITIQTNTMVPIRDGMRLATDVYRLDGAPPAPVLMARTPYDKDGLVGGRDTFDIHRWCSPAMRRQPRMCAGGMPPKARSTLTSFYGRLGVVSTDVEKFRAWNLPASYFAHSTRDPFVLQFEACVAALQPVGVLVESHALDDLPHSLGVGDGPWTLGFDKWLVGVFGS